MNYRALNRVIGELDYREKSLAEELANAEAGEMFQTVRVVKAALWEVRAARDNACEYRAAVRNGASV
jgi:hypothetical protein